MYTAQSDLIRIFIFLLIFLTVPPVSIQSNPFQCKIPSGIVIHEKKPENILVFKGYAIIDENIYGLIMIGNHDYEVLKGDEIKGYRILKVSKIGLEYLYEKEKRRTVLESQ